VEDFTAIAREIDSQSGVRCAQRPQRRIGAGSIHACWRWPADPDALFVKLATPASLPVFEAEAAGLRELAAARALRVPAVVALGTAGGAAFLAIEWLQSLPITGGQERALGEGLAALHALTAPRFGWQRDNTIGRTAQANGWSADWADFFATRRLAPQLALAEQNGFGALLSERGARLTEALPWLLAGHAPAPALLHGDLWGGNWLATTSGPSIFDPAVYFGDREADLAMTRLFGGFGDDFYRAYEARSPLAPGAPARSDLYNLYHVLNHANLFGGGYARQARALIDRLLAAVGH
jgi:protein-ribulosamine 3-kinase